MALYNRAGPDLVDNQYRVPQAASWSILRAGARSYGCLLVRCCRKNSRTAQAAALVAKLERRPVSNLHSTQILNKFRVCSSENLGRRFMSGHEYVTTMLGNRT